jgi:hypothetical protein
MINDARTYRKITCGSDHQLLKAKIYRSHTVHNDNQQNKQPNEQLEKIRKNKI